MPMYLQLRVSSADAPSQRVSGCRSCCRACALSRNCATIMDQDIKRQTALLAFGAELACCV